MEPTNKKGHKHKQEYKGGRPFKHDIEGILGRADFEIARLKKIESSSTKSLFTSIITSFLLQSFSIVLHF